MVRVLAGVLALAIGVGVGAYVVGGRAPGPVIEILEPTRLVGRNAVFEATVDSPRGELTILEAVIEQGDRSFPLFSLDQPLNAEIKQDGPDRVRVATLGAGHLRRASATRHKFRYRYSGSAPIWLAWDRSSPRGNATIFGPLFDDSGAKPDFTDVPAWC